MNRFLFGLLAVLIGCWLVSVALDAQSCADYELQAGVETRYSLAEGCVGAEGTITKDRR